TFGLEAVWLGVRNTNDVAPGKGFYQPFLHLALRSALGNEGLCGVIVYSGRTLAET
nr:hypothetical protein [Tanacetum cinerariifolium]